MSMVLNNKSLSVIYGAFYLNGCRIKELESKTITCTLLDIYGREVQELTDITVAEDGSVCVVIEPNTLPEGRYYYSIVLEDAENGILSEIKNEIEVV